jgi:hypothetical protein
MIIEMLLNELFLVLIELSTPKWVIFPYKIGFNAPPEGYTSK